MGLSRKKAFGEVRGTVPASGTLGLDEQPADRFSAARYVIKMWNTAEDKVMVLEMTAIYEGGVVSDQVYNKQQYSLDVDVNFVKDGADVKLWFVNNESFDVDVSALIHPLT